MSNGSTSTSSASAPPIIHSPKHLVGDRRHRYPGALPHDLSDFSCSAWSFRRGRRGDEIGEPARARTLGRPSRGTRKTVLMTLAVGVLFLAGYLFTEIWPAPFMIRLAAVFGLAD